MQEPNLMPFQNLPFNGDEHVCNEFLKLKEKYNLTTAIETGSCLFSTTEWLGKNFDKVYTVEVNEEFAKHGRHKIAEMPNVISNIDDSIVFLKHIFQFDIQPEERCILFLDAHWNDVCPLLGELQAIANIGTIQPPVIVIHDFYTGNPELGFDEYKGQPFTFEWISKYVNEIEHISGCNYTYYYNAEAVGAKRGLIYLVPLIKLQNNDTETETQKTETV